MGASLAQIESFLTSVLRGFRGWPDGWGDYEIERCLELSDHHGILPLLQRAIRQASGMYPSRLRDELERAARDAAATELMARHDVAELCARLAERGIRAVILKGTALAYLYYPLAELRPRVDVDMLIGDDDRHRMQTLLRELGYVEQPAVRGEHIRQQVMFTHRIACHVHWKLSNSPSFSNMLSFAEVWSESVPISAISEHARAPSVTHLLLHACAHRVAHHQASRRMIWLYDIDLLVRALDARQREIFWELALERRLGAVCLDGVSAAAALFDTPVSWDLDELRARTQDEPTREFLNGELKPLRALWLELRALPNWQQRLAYVREHLLPDPEYLRWRYAAAADAWLPPLYARRLMSGLLMHLRRRNQPMVDVRDRV